MGLFFPILYFNELLLMFHYWRHPTGFPVRHHILSYQLNELNAVCVDSHLRCGGAVSKCLKTSHRTTRSDCPWSWAASLYRGDHNMPWTEVSARHITTCSHSHSLRGAARCSSVVTAFAHGAMGRRIDPSWWTHWAISRSSQCTMTGVTKTGMCNPVCGMVHIKEPLLLIRKSSPWRQERVFLSLSEWFLYHISYAI